MSSNGSISPNMNPAPSGASAYEPEQTGVHHSLHHCYIWLGALRAARCANHLHMRAFLIVGAYEIS